MNCDKCAICNKDIEDDTKLYVSLTDKGALGVCNASKERSDDLLVKAGDKVHRACRDPYINKKNIQSYNKKKSFINAESNNNKRSLRASQDFNYKLDCLFCMQSITEKEKRYSKAYQVMCKNREFDQSILNACEQRNDQWALEVKGRIAFVNDLHSEDAVYHQVCSANFRTGKGVPQMYHRSTQSEPSSKRGRPSDVNREVAFMFVANYLKDNDDEQITVNDLLSLMQNHLKESSSHAFTAKWLKNRLIEHFKDEIVFTEINGKQNVVTFRSKARKILHDFYKSSKSDDDETEKNRIIETAAHLLRNEIKESERSSLFYPSTADIESRTRCKEFLPSSLRLLLEKMFVAKISDLRVASIGHAIMQAVRPKAIIAPLQIGLGVQLHRQFGSRFLIDSLYSHGFCSSYTEVQNFERSAAYHQGIEIKGLNNESFIQHIGDNVDHNIRTIDGLNTFHGMGIIAAVTPPVNATKLVPKVEIESKDIVQIGSIETHIFRKNRKSSSSLKYEDLQQFFANDPTERFDTLWKSAWMLKPLRPLWNGFMQMIHKGEHPGQSSIIFMPMIDMKSSDESCILSTMHFVTDQAKRYDSSPILTFDQPLYWKGIEIQQNENDSSPLKEIVFRLGGLHTSMSFLGSIGHLMTSTGLQTMLECVYAENTVPHMLSGKAISRAVRGHLLVIASLHAIMMSEIYDCPVITENDGETDNSSELFCMEDNVDLTQISNLLDNTIVAELTIEDLDGNEAIRNMLERIETYKNKLSSSRTANLWFQYMEMVQILCKFIKAERIGHFNLHLQAVSDMLPFFAASGHSLYAKSAYIYLQEMSNLQETHPNVYIKFQQGYHVVRRSDRFWAGLSTDLVIEQVLMRNLKSTGGLTRGRGMTELQRAIWLFSTPACAEVNRAMQEVTNVAYETSEQHKEASPARLSRDFKDAMKILWYAMARNPFDNRQELMSIDTGEVASSAVNVDDAKKIGKGILQSMSGSVVADYTFRRKENAVTMKARSTIQVDGEIISVDPLLMFQRLITAVRGLGSELDLETAFSYELCTFPPSLIESDGLLREANKPQIANSIWSLMGPDVASFPEDPLYILDGGSLLHKVMWVKGKTYYEVCNNYVDYVIKHYGEGTTVVFDGYDDKASTKDSTHVRRTKGKQGISVHFTGEMKLNMKKNEFLTNLKNKQRFLEMLVITMNQANLHAIQSSGDADLLIVQTAIELAVTRPAVVIGEDTDLLILLLHHVKPDCNDIFFTSEQKSRARCPAKFWDIKYSKSKLGPAACEAILLMHALLGCDTTSRLFSIGKGVALQKFKREERFRYLSQTFSSPSSTREEIIIAGEELLLIVYGAKGDPTLDKLRVTRFCEKVATSMKMVSPESLPPTSASASFHSMRVYHQVQVWKGRDDLDPEEWGWVVKRGKLFPVYSSQPPAPPSLLKLFRCNCKKECRDCRCTCYKNELKCSNMCGECRGVSCMNCEYPGDNNSSIDNQSEDDI